MSVFTEILAAWWTEHGSEDRNDGAKSALHLFEAFQEPSLTQRQAIRLPEFDGGHRLVEFAEWPGLIAGDPHIIGDET